MGHCFHLKNYDYVYLKANDGFEAEHIGYIGYLSWDIAIFVQKLPILKIFCPILDILDIDLLKKT